MLKRVLIVDDELNLLKTLEIILLDEGFEIDTCSSPIEAIEKIKKRKYRCIISDIKMPEMSGIEFIKKARETDEDVPVILMTAYATVETAIQALRSGVYDYILKPFEHENIIRVISKAVEYSLLKDENESLKEEIKEYYNKKVVTGNSKVAKEIEKMILRVADSDTTVLITGESGTGKEIAAYEIHSRSKRNKGPFITLNCTAIPNNLIESEFFGHEKGAFTGADIKRKGKFELANGGTIFLDEIGDMKLEMQSKLLRVIQERKIERIGGSQKIDVDVRIIAATNKNLKKAVEQGSFRDDLFFRINVFPISLISLKDRKEDIKEFSYYFLNKFSNINGKFIKEISKDALNYLRDYHWPGNIRELSNVIERAIILCDSSKIKKEHIRLTFYDEKNNEKLLSLEEMEKKHIINILNAVDNNKSKAAGILEIDRTTLYRLCKKYKIEQNN